MPYVSKKNGGIFQYSIALLKILANSEHNYFVYCNDPEEELLHLIEQYPNLKLFQCKKKERKHHIFSRKLAASVLDKILRTIKSDYRVKFTNTNFHLKELIKKHQIQIIHSPIQENIFINEKIPTISTMHDVQELHFPMFFDSQERLWRAKNFKHTIENSHAVIVSYEHIKKDIHNYFDNTGDRYSEYKAICSHIRKECKVDHIDGGMVGQYNPSITQRLHGLTDKSDITTNGKDINEIKVNIIKADGDK